jgi:mRNA-degrading endonuclease RelE of RelBE toxin-antitoxin system
LKRIVFSGEAKAGIRAIPKPIAMNILEAVRRLAETGAGKVKMLTRQERDKRLRVGDFRVRFTEDEEALHNPHRQESQGRVPLRRSP